MNNFAEFERHVLFHGFHTKIKEKGLLMLNTVFNSVSFPTTNAK